MTVPTAELTLSIEPETAPLWQRRRITVTGALPGSLLTISATTLRDGATWTAQAVFLVGVDGALDLDADAPVSGDYRVADAMGLFWSQHREGVVADAVTPDPLATLVTTFTARTEPGTGRLDVPGPGAGAATTTATAAQQVLTPGTTVRDVTEDALVGTVYTPAGVGPFPTVIVLNGSGGGIPHQRAALYASRGIQAFALGFFRAPGLPRWITGTPLEYFERALAFAERTLEPAGGRPAVSGGSRGGELTLLLAARFPDRIAAIAAFVPGAFAFGAQGAADPATGWSGPTWTWRGEPLEHLWHDNAAVTWQPWDGDAPPHRTADVYVDGLRDRPLARAARIPIERFPGPVACISGLDDRAWPSSMASRIALSTLEAHGHAAERLHLDYVDAGHAIGLPHLPTTTIDRRHPVSGVPFTGGGTPRGNAVASADSFDAVCDFLIRSTALTA